MLSVAHSAERLKKVYTSQTDNGSEAIWNVGTFSDLCCI